MAITKVIREAARYAKNNAPKRVSAKNSRKAANDAKKRGTTRRTEKSLADKAELRKTQREKISTKLTKTPPKNSKDLAKLKADIAKTNRTMTTAQLAKKFPKSKAAKKSLLRKYGIPLGVISSILAGSTLLNKNEKVAKKVVAKPAAKKEEPMKRRFRAGPTAGSGLGGQRRSGTLRGKNVVANPPKRKNEDTAKRPRRPSGPSMTSMVAKAPKPRNKNVTKRPKRPSKQGSFGR